MNEEAKKNIPQKEIELNEEALDTVSGGFTTCDNVFFDTCRNCGKQFATGYRGSCPFCGAERIQQEAGN